MSRGMDVSHKSLYLASMNPMTFRHFAGYQYPHGLRFTPDGRFILVADTGSPYVVRGMHAVHQSKTGAGRKTIGLVKA